MRRGDERGQATVELALVMPVIVVGLLLVVQAALVLAQSVATVHAAREAARAVAVDPSPGVADAAVRSTGLDRCVTRTDRPAEVGAVTRVEVRCVARTDVALVGPLLPDITLTAHASMRVER